MAIATTGPLALNLTIRTEELIKNSSLPATDISTREISESAGFVEPDAFSEFYGYSSAVLPTMASIRLRGGPNDNYFNVGATPATNGFVAITSRGFYMGTDSRGPQYNTRYQVDTSNSLGEFNKSFGGLAGSRTYYIWGYVQNQIGEGYTSRFAVATLRTIPVSNTREGNFYGSAQGPMYMPIYHGGNAGKIDTELHEVIKSQRSCSDWGNHQFLQRFYARMSYLHPYYGWVSNAGSDVEWVSYTSWRNTPSGWGTAQSGHNIGWYGTLKIADGAATRQRKYIHALNNVDTYGCSGNAASIDFGGWFVYTDMSYSGISSTNSFTVEKAQNFNGYGVSNSYYSSYWNGGTYAPYYDFGRIEYGISYMNSYSSGYYLGITGTQYWYQPS